MMNGRKAIQQQYFTRDREGVFRTSEGFDTVAKSEGLDPAFIKTTLNPFCIYKAPKELLGRGEEDVSLYPESLVVFHADNGDMVIGRSCFVGADFTGQRSASFTHQFIVPKERKEAFLLNPERLLHISSFQSAYDIREGKQLPELDEIEYDTFAESRNGIVRTEQLLSRLGIDQTRFQQLIYTVMSSVTNKKKVYIILDADVTESAELAKKLLLVIYGCIPYATRRQLGFMTFSSEPEGKQGLHMVFVEKGGIRQPDRNIEREHVFDFPNNRFIHNELPAQEHDYLEFIWKHVHSPDQLDPLFEFCEEALQGAPSNTALRVQSYYELFSLYEIEQGNHALYAANRATAMQAIATYTSAETAQPPNRLNQLFIALLRKDAVDATILPDDAYIKYLLQYYAIADEGVRALLNTCFVIFISRAANRSAQEGMAEAAQLFDQLLGRDKMFDAVMNGLYGHQASTAEGYVAYRMAKAGTVKELVEEIRFWIQHGESIVEQRFFANEILKKVKRLLQTDTVFKKVEAANALFRYFDELPERANKPHYEDFCGQLKLEIQLELLETLKPTSLEYDDIVQLGFLLEKTDQELNSHLNSRQKQTMHLLGTIYKVLLMAKKEDSELVKAIDRLDTLDLERVQESLKKLLFLRITPEHFSKIVYAFYRPSLGRNSGYVAEFDYYGMLEYVAEKGRDMIYDFLVWSAEDSRFLNPKQGIDANYRAAVSKFFDVHAPKAFRDKEIKQKLLASQNDSFIAFYNVIKLRQSEEWVRFLVKNKRLLTRSGLTIVAIVVLLIVFRSPLAMLIAYMGPAPVLVVEAMPVDSAASTVTLEASADHADPGVQLFVNGEFIGNGKASKTLDLKDGNNVFEFKAVNRGGKASEVIRKEVTYVMPAPIVTIEALPEVTRNNTIVVKVGAADIHDPNPTLFINGQAAGQTNVTKTVELKPGDNTIEIKAVNNSGKASEPILKKIKYEPAAAK
jgi:hypothetical protein